MTQIPCRVRMLPSSDTLLGAAILGFQAAVNRPQMLERMAQVSHLPCPRPVAPHETRCTLIAHVAIVLDPYFARAGTTTILQWRT